MSEKPTVHDDVEHQSEDWHLRGCAAFDKRTGGAQKTRLGGLRAILTSADRMWDNGKVTRYLISTLSRFFDLIMNPLTDHHLLLRQARWDEDSTKQSEAGHQGMGILRQHQVQVRFGKERDHSHCIRGG